MTMDNKTTIVVGGLAVVAFLGALYLLTRPKPESDVSFSQVATLVATVAAYY
jgi:hypothetical protein